MKSSISFNLKMPPLIISRVSFIVVSFGLSFVFLTSRAADDESTDYSALIKAVNDLRSSVEHEFSVDRDIFSTFSQGVEDRLIYPVYTTFTDYIESPADHDLDSSYRGINSRPEAYGLGPEWSESGPYPERYERYLINLIGKTYDNTYLKMSGGFAPATWDEYGYGHEGDNTPSDVWTNRLGWIWNNAIPSIYRKNNVASFGFGTPKISSSSINWGANTSLPDGLNFTYSPDQTIVSLLLRMAAEQHAFNQWVSYGGLLANIPFNYDDRNQVTNLVRGSAFQLPIFENPDMPDYELPYTKVTDPDGRNTGFTSSLVSYLRIRNLQSQIPLTVASEYLYDENNLNLNSKDPFFYSLIDHFHDSSYINTPDEAYNPDGVMTNLPLLYHEDTLIPASWQDASIPPSLDQYAALQRAKIINRLSILAWTATNSFSNLDITNVVQDSSENLTNSAAATSYFSEKYGSWSNDIDTAFLDIVPQKRRNEIFKPFEDFKDELERSDFERPYVRFQFPNYGLNSGDDDLELALPSYEKKESYMQECSLFFWKVLFFFFYASLAIGEWKYWTLHTFFNATDGDRLYRRIEDPD